MFNFKSIKLVLSSSIRIIFDRFTPVLLFLMLFGCLNLLSAQTIGRVSVADRADGLGHVIRFHSTAQPDSFQIVQSSSDFIQVIFYGRNLNIEASVENMRKPLSEVNFHTIPGAIGVDIHLEKNSRFISRIYGDANRRDVLIGLTRASRSDVDAFVRGFSPLIWDDFQPIAEEPDEDISDSEDTLFPPPITRSTVKFDTIVIDPGHGGRDPGSIGSRGTYEKNVALAISLKLGELIKQHLPDLKIVYTRTDDRFIGLDERGRIANRHQGDLFISVHANSHQLRQPHGAEFFFLGMNRSQAAIAVTKRENSVIQFEENGTSNELTEEQLLIYELSNSGYMASSRRFAELLDHQFSQRAQRRSRGVKQAGLQVLWEASMPGVLVEVGFISNPEEERFVTSEYGQNILASAIFRAVREFKEMTERSNTNRNSGR